MTSVTRPLRSGFRRSFPRPIVIGTRTPFRAHPRILSRLPVCPTNMIAAVQFVTMISERLRLRRWEAMPRVTLRSSVAMVRAHRRTSRSHPICTLRLLRHYPLTRIFSAACLCACNRRFVESTEIARSGSQRPNDSTPYQSNTCAQLLEQFHMHTTHKLPTRPTDGVQPTSFLECHEAINLCAE